MSKAGVPSKGGKKLLSVTELVHSLSSTLEAAFPRVAFEGEISQISRPASGHIYLSLKDDRSQLSCAMWRSRVERVQVPLEEGTAVICYGRPNVYHATGRLQVILDRIELAGEGALRKKFIELQKRLAAEGLFAEERKRPIPFWPSRIGVVTSETGAVIHDIMVKIRQRMPQQRVLLAPARVQGDGAAEEIVSAIKRLNESKLVDVIIVARGGGSLEDLWPFNEEVVARAIFASRVPIISGVGHEVDTTLADFVADYRAPTPTAAAEAAVPLAKELLAEVARWEVRLQNTDRWFSPFQQRVDTAEVELHRGARLMVGNLRERLKLAYAGLRFIEPTKVFQAEKERTNERELRLQRAFTQTVVAARARFRSLETRHLRSKAAVGLAARRAELEACAWRIAAGAKSALQVSRAQFDKVQTQLISAGPEKVLSRGFAYVKKDHVALSSAKDVQKGDEVEVVLHDGAFGAQVKQVHRESFFQEGKDKRRS